MGNNNDDKGKQTEREKQLEKEIEKARQEGKSEAWIRMNIDI